MTCKAIIFDLDNTIYPVHSIADELFRSLFQLLDESGEASERISEIKDAVQRKPFQWVAEQYGLSDSLTQRGVQLLRELSINGAIHPFDDYKDTRNLPVEKFLVTTGFAKLQHSKIEKMGIKNDFKEIHVVDPETTSKTKKDIFREILERNSFQPSQVLVVGDDPESEIKAAEQLGIRAVLYDKLNLNRDTALERITDFFGLQALLA